MISGLGLKISIQSMGSKVQGPKFRLKKKVQDPWFRIQNLQSMVQSLRFRI